MPDTLTYGNSGHAGVSPADSVVSVPARDTVAKTTATAPRPVAPVRHIAPDTVLVADSLQVDSLAVDSIDSLAVAPPVVTKPAPPRPPQWTTGIEPRPLVRNDATDPGILSAIVVVVVLVLFSIRHTGKLMPALFKDLLSVRTRAKAFDEHTANETRIMVIYGLQLTLFLAILVMSVVNMSAGRLPMAGGFLTLLPFLGLCGAYYLFQLCAYNTVGFAFASNTGRRLWLRGFNASQALLGFAIALPALVVVFYPTAANSAVLAAAALYLIARLIFISKGLRIFYDNFSSLVYFILYLCTLEIIPLLFIFNNAARNL